MVRSPARAAVLWEGADWQALGLASALFAPRARVALAALGEVFARQPDLAPGIHPSALIDPTATIGDDAWIAYDSSRGNEFNLYLARVKLYGSVETEGGSIIIAPAPARGLATMVPAATA